MRRGRSPQEGQPRTPRHPDNQIQALAEWLQDHGWSYQATHTWTWPPTGKTMQLPQSNCMGTQWLIAATATAIKAMNELGTTRTRTQATATR